jgi:glycosyltransferase involved in cell wall biosynthesis
MSATGGRSVLHVVLSLEVGGLERVVYHLMQAQQGGRYEPLLCCLDRPGRWGDELAKRGYRVFALDRWGGVRPRILFELLRLIREVQPAVVHAHNPGPLVYAAPAARLARRPLIFTRHGPGGRTSHPLIWRITDQVVAVSEDARRTFLRYNRVLPERTCTIHNGIPDLPPGLSRGERQALRRSLGFDPELPLIGTVCRLEPAKDLGTLLHAFERITAAGTPAQLLIVGDGSQREELQQRRARSPRPERIVLAGMRQDVPAILRVIDIFAVSSILEGLSVSLLEAMAAGLPAVATSVGGNPEAVEHEVSGLLVPPRDPDALAEALLRLLRDPELRARYGRAARAKYEQGFTIEAMRARYEEVYDRCRRRDMRRPNGGSLPR